MKVTIAVALAGRLNLAPSAAGGDPESPAPPQELLEGLLEDAKAVPLDEGAQQVDSVGGRQLALHFAANAGLVARR